MNSKFESNPVVSALHDAAAVAERLSAIHCTVLSAYANGRRPVLVIDRPPPFVQGAVKRQHPDGVGGIERVFAAGYHGVQLEWIDHVPASREVGHG